MKSPTKKPSKAKKRETTYQTTQGKCKWEVNIGDVIAGIENCSNEPEIDLSQSFLPPENAVYAASKVAQTIAERGKIYGDPHDSHTNIGLAWTGLIQQKYGITLEYPIPAETVALMMVQFKCQRACRVFHEDNFVDLHAYGNFAEESQKKNQAKL